jgi:hypothetical protein
MTRKKQTNTTQETNKQQAQTYKQGNICHSTWDNGRPFGDDTILHMVVV